MKEYDYFLIWHDAQGNKRSRDFITPSARNQFILENERNITSGDCYQRVFSEMKYQYSFNWRGNDQL